MKLIKGSDFLELGKAMAELERLCEGPVHRITISHDTIFGSRRFDAGTYEIRRVDPKPDDEKF